MESFLESSGYEDIVKVIDGVPGMTIDSLWYGEKQRKDVSNVSDIPLGRIKRFMKEVTRFVLSLRLWEGVTLGYSRAISVDLGGMIDVALGGGIPFGITEITGEAGVGKTQLICQLVLNVQKYPPFGFDRSAVILSTEGQFPVERIAQMATFDTSTNKIFIQNIGAERSRSLLDILRNDLVSFIKSEGQEERPVGLVVIDSITAPVRSDFDISHMRERFLFSVYDELLSLTRLDVSVVISNQVSDYFPEEMSVYEDSVNNPQFVSISSGRMVVPALGVVWGHCVMNRFALSHNGDSRTISLVFSNQVSPISVNFVIGEKGVTGEQ